MNELKATKVHMYTLLFSVSFPAWERSDVTVLLLLFYI